MTLIPTQRITQSKSGLYKVRHGLYSDTTPRGPKHEHYLQTLGALQTHTGPHVVSHISAALAHGLPLFNEDLTTVHLTTPAPARRGKKAGVHIHAGSIDEAVAVNGILLTPITRTLLDCARTIPRDQAVAMTDFALHEGLVTEEELWTEIQRMSKWRLDQMRDVVHLSDGRAESVGESRSRLILWAGGFAVTPQVWARDEDGVAFARIDLVLNGRRLGVEFEGRAKGVDDSGRSNKERNDLVEDRNWIIVPVYWEHCENPQLLLARVHRGLRRLKTLEGR